VARTFSEARIYVNEWNLSGRANAGDLDLNRPVAGVTAFEDTAHEFVQGLNTRGWELDVRSWWDGTDDEIDEIIHALLGAGVANDFGIYFDGAAAGSHGYEMRGGLIRDTVRMPHDGGGALDFRAQGGVFGRAMKLLEAATITATGGQTGQNHMAVTDGDRIIYVTRITAVTGAGSVQFRLEEDDNSGFTTPTTVATNTAQTAVGVERSITTAATMPGPWFRDNVVAYSGFTNVTARTAVAILPMS
jgi:hypothetical protein